MPLRKAPSEYRRGFSDWTASADAVEAEKLVEFGRGKLPTAETGYPHTPTGVIQRSRLRDGNVRNDPVRHQALVVPGGVNGEDLSPSRLGTTSAEAVFRDRRQRSTP